MTRQMAYVNDEGMKPTEAFAIPCTNKSYEPSASLREVIIFNFTRISTKLAIAGMRSAISLTDRAVDIIADRSAVVRGRIVDVALELSQYEIYGDGSEYLEIKP